MEKLGGISAAHRQAWDIAIRMGIVYTLKENRLVYHTRTYQVYPSQFLICGLSMLPNVLTNLFL